MYQCDYATGCPDIWSNIIVGVSVRVLVDEINISISRLSKANCSPWWGWVSVNELKTRIEQMAKRELFLPYWLSWNNSLFWPLDSVWNICLDLQTEGFWTRNYTIDSTSLQTWAAHWILTTGHPGLLACQLQVFGHHSHCNCVSYFLFEETSFSLSLSLKHTHTHTHSPLRNFLNENSIFMYNIFMFLSLLTHRA